LTAIEVQKRNERAQQLRVLKTEDSYFVESADGKICYKVTLTNEGFFCACGDYAHGSKNDANFKCKHILAVTESTTNGELQGAEVLERRRPKLDERFLINIHGKDFVLYAGLLDLAHQKGLLKLDVTPIQYPSKENNMEAICVAVAESKYGESFKDIGDANPLNTDKTIAKHILRMASTRAKSRALRDFVNVGMTAFEELGSLDEVVVAESQGRSPDRKAIPRKEDPKKLEPHLQGVATTEDASKRETSPAPVQGVQLAPSSSSGNGKKLEPMEPKASEAPQSVQQEGKKQAGKPATSASPIPGISEAQKRAIYNLGRRRGLSVEELHAYAKQRFNVDKVEDIAPGDASAFIRLLQTSN
jgi:hypothetical protein